MDILKEIFNGKSFRDIVINEGTGNFYYENRCVVVTDEDAESDNVPPTEDLPGGIENNRNYPRRLIKAFEYGIYVVLTNGYYEGGCIDWVREEELDPESPDWANDDDHFLENYVQPYFNNIYIEYQDKFNDLDIPTQDRAGIVAEIRAKVKELYDAEIKKANDYIDKLMEDYGYEEYGTTGVMSNGEAVYHKIKKKVPVSPESDVFESIGNK